MATTPQTNTDFESIASFLKAHDNFVICGHVSPDGDCLGSQLALWHGLKSLGKTATCILASPEPVPQTLAFLPGIDKMVPARDFDGPADVFVGTDVPSRERAAADACAIRDRSPHSVTIDHHACDTTMCDLVYVDPDSASASLLIWEVVKRLCEQPPIESAVCAYTGLVTDTGGFRFQNSDARAFMAGAELVAYGVDPAYVAACAFQNRTMASLKLEEVTISRMRLTCDGAVAMSWIERADMERLGALKSDAEPLIDTLRSVSGVRIACMLREQDGTVRGSLRSKDSTDVSDLARELGGGGHKAAAGFTLDMDLANARNLLEAKTAELLRDSDGR